MSVRIGLTTEPSMSSCGQHVLRIHTDDGCKDCLPGDLIAETGGRMVLARDVASRWLSQPGRTAQDVELRQRFLG